MREAVRYQTIGRYCRPLLNDATEVDADAIGDGKAVLIGGIME
jgi:hypothetical protein